MRTHLDWVIILQKNATDKSHAKGLRVCEKLAETFEGDDKTTVLYKYGDFYVHRDEVEMEWSIDGFFTPKWVKFEQPYKPSFLERIFRKKHPSTIKVRPKDGSLVICRYSVGYCLLMEYSNYTWITDLFFPVEPDEWAYVPDECVKAAENYIKDKKKKA